MNKKFSLIIPAYNSGKTIYECLNSVCFSQKMLAHEIIVVDDCSTDDTLDKVKKFSVNPVTDNGRFAGKDGGIKPPSETSNLYPRRELRTFSNGVKVLSLDKRCGAAIARNEGAKICAGDIIVFIDSDILPADNWLVEIENSFDEYSDIDVVQGVYDIDCSKKNLAELARNYYKCHNISKLENGELISGINSYCFAIKREVFTKIGGFNSDAEKVEDVEIAHRLVKSGYKILLNKNVRVKHLKQYTLFGLLECDYHKVLAKTKIFLSGYFKGDSGITFSLNKINGMSNEIWTMFLSGAALFSAFCAFAFKNPVFVYLGLLIFLALISLNLNFFSLMKKNGGVFVAVGCMFVYFCEMFIALLAVLSGIIECLFKTTNSIKDIVSEKLRWGKKIVFHSLAAMPEQVTLFVTNKCNLKCRHCFYWRDLNKNNDEFSIDELKKILPTMGRFSFVSLAGGEPFLRSDIPKIVALLVNVNKVRRISIPTNGYFTRRIVELTKEILRICRDKSSILVKVSLDGIGEAHDSIRGMKGSFDKAAATFFELKLLKREHKNLKIGILLTVSKLNERSLAETASYVMDKLSPDIVGLNFIRGDLKECSIKAAEVKNYRQLYRDILKWLADKKQSSGFYYEFYHAYKNEISRLIHEIVETGKYPLECYAGGLSAMIDSSLNVYPCEILSKKMGNLRESDYDFKKLWFSANASGIRDYIGNGSCCCTHECNLQINSFFNSKQALKLLTKTLKNKFGLKIFRQSAEIRNKIKEGDLI